MPVRGDAPEPQERHSGILPSEAIINPTREPWDQPVTDRVILTFTLPDYRYLCRLIQPAEPPRYIYNCALREGHWEDQAITLMAPALGAPYGAPYCSLSKWNNVQHSAEVHEKCHDSHTHGFAEQISLVKPVMK